MSRLHYFRASALTAAVLSLMFAGCASIEHHPDIPAGAVMGSEGTGRLAYTAPEDGMVYVYDVTAEQMIYSGRVERNETVVVNPQENRVVVAERNVAERALSPGNIHRLYFSPKARVVHERRIHEEIRIEER